MGLILAAGVGSRLRGLLGAEKVLARVGRLRLICYPLSSMAYTGVSEVVVVTRRELVGVMEDAARSCPAPSKVRVAVSERWWAGSGWTLLDGLQAVESGGVVVSVADHIYTPRVVERLVAGCQAPYCVAGDSLARLADKDEATRILAGRDGYVLEIGKGIERYTHVDVGVHYFSMPLVPSSCLGHELSLNDVKRCLARRRMLQLVDVTGEDWIDVDTPGEYAKAVRGEASRLAKEVAGLWG